MQKIIEWIKWLFGFGKPKTVEHKRHPIIDLVMDKKVEVYGKIKTTPGGHHALYETSVGVVRKPIQS